MPAPFKKLFSGGLRGKKRKKKRGPTDGEQIERGAPGAEHISNKGASGSAQSFHSRHAEARRRLRARPGRGCGGVFSVMCYNFYMWIKHNLLKIGIWICAGVFVFLPSFVLVLFLLWLIVLVLLVVDLKTD